jgi:protein-tyrosine phosphatase
MKLDWPDCRNARDLGGLATTDGARIRAGALIRSDNHDRLTPAAIQSIRDSGVRRILDLRWAWEIAKYPSPFAGDPIYRHVSLLEDGSDYEPPPDTYGPMLDSHRARIGAAFIALAEAPPGGVVVHCHGGRDRTGALVALALTVAGVPADAVIADYALTTDTEAIAMHNTLTHLTEMYGGAVPYLLAAGVQPSHIEAVRTRLLAASPV